MMSEFQYLRLKLIAMNRHCIILYVFRKVPGKKKRSLTVANAQDDECRFRFYVRCIMIRVQNIRLYSTTQIDHHPFLSYEMCDIPFHYFILSFSPYAIRGTCAGFNHNIKRIAIEHIKKSADMILIRMRKHNHIDRTVPARHDFTERTEDGTRRRSGVVEQLIPVRCFHEHRVTLADIKKHNGKYAVFSFQICSENKKVYDKK